MTKYREILQLHSLGFSHQNIAIEAMSLKTVNTVLKRATDTNRQWSVLTRLSIRMETCKRYYKSKYVRLPDLLLDLKMARSEGNYRKVLSRNTNPILLVIDDDFY